MALPDCPEPLDLAGFVAGTLSRQRTAEVARHVSGCADCERALASFDELPDPLLSRLRRTDLLDAGTVDYVPAPLLVAARSALGPVAPAEPPPRRVGRFELFEEVGSGSFGHVFRARDTELDRPVAIKVLRAGRLASHEEVDRFLREARSAAQLKHPGIVSVYESGQTKDGTCYLVEEFVPGATLAERLRAGRLACRAAAGLVAQAALALDYALRRGVIHRDIKPSNILLDPEGRPHLMDFGLAKREADETPMTLD